MQLIQGDCLEVMRGLPDDSVDLVLADPPYGTTACKWDSIIPLEPMWEQLKRVAKPNAAIVMTASQPFTTTLIASNMKMFKYCWVWHKPRPTGFANAKKQPLRDAEDVVVFGCGRVTYNPQGVVRVDKTVRNSETCGGDTVRGETSLSGGKGSLRTAGKEYKQEFSNYPRLVLKVANNSAGRSHPTQKPVALMEYMIRTYSNEGETVLDFTMGSGTTGVACLNTGRDFIGIEKDPDYCRVASQRIARAGDQLGLAV